VDKAIEVVISAHPTWALDAEMSFFILGITVKREESFWFAL